jgi:hypothetical protein
MFIVVMLILFALVTGQSFVFGGYNNTLTGGHVGVLLIDWFVMLSFILLGFFVFRGSQFAIVATMIIWTIDRAYYLWFVSLGSLIWWFALIIPCYVALKVELKRRGNERQISNVS